MPSVPSLRPSDESAGARRAIRAVAIFEGFKGLVVALAASGGLALLHHDVHELAARLVAHAHLNPAAKFPRIFLDAAASVNDARLWQLAAGAALYAGVRLVESYGLFHERAWAEVLAAASGAIYVPFEVMELVHRPTPLAAGLLLANLAVVALMLQALARRRARGAAG